MRTCAICKRSGADVDEWHTVVTESPIGDTWEETSRVGVCSWACLRLAFLASPDEREGDTPEAWKAEGTDF